MAHSLTTDQQYAFISVFDKTDLEVVAKALVDVYGYTLISTGGTKTYLAQHGIEAIESSTITGFDELAGGRVKSLHPEIFAGLLDERIAGEPKPPFYLDTVIVNLYPFEAGYADFQQGEKTADDLIHLIDVGGPSLIRAGAKNYTHVNVLSDPSQYAAFLQELKLGDGQTSAPFRKNLAHSAFKRTYQYDQAISAFFAEDLSAQNQTDSSQSELASSISLNLTKVSDLRYGENPHQQAALYQLPNTKDLGFKQWHGKALSYNNLVDMMSAWNIVSEFTDIYQPACAIIKHNNPCGVALGTTVADAYHTAFFADSLSAFGGVVAFNQPVTVQAAEQMKDVFLEVIIAPGFDADALAVLQAKKNLRLIERPFASTETKSTMDIKVLDANHLLIQQTLVSNEASNEASDEAQRMNKRMNKPINIDALIQAGQVETVTQTKPTPQQIKDMIFAWKVAKHVKSNAIVLAKEGRTVGIGVGQTSRIGALEIALRQACDEADGAVMASDGFFPAVDNIHAAVQARVSAIIQPGGSIKDGDVIETANQFNLPMLTTGIREFRH